MTIRPGVAGLLRGLLYVVLAGAVAAAFGWWSMWDCTREHSGPGEDSSLCGVGLFLAVPAFAIGLLVVAVVGELVVARRRVSRRAA